MELKTWQCSLRLYTRGAIINEEVGGLSEGSNCEALERIKEMKTLKFILYKWR